ncbi:hypothetical protein YC2023_029678 [Brassica napus]
MERSKNHRESPEKMERSVEEERKRDFASNSDGGERYRGQALENVKAALASSQTVHTKRRLRRELAIPRKAAGQSWEDPTLAEWPENDYRLFCGDLGNEVNDDVLSKAFARFPTFNMAKVKCVIRDKRTGKTKGYGFVSFLNPADLAAALKEMNGKYVGNRPIKLRKSSWKERTDQEAAERQKANNSKLGTKDNCGYLDLMELLARPLHLCSPSETMHVTTPSLTNFIMTTRPAHPEFGHSHAEHRPQPFHYEFSLTP